MIFTNAHVVDQGSGTDLTLEEFRTTPAARTTLGELLIALAEEEAWSKGYSVRGIFNLQTRDEWLRASHPDFPPGHEFQIGKTSGISTVEGFKRGLRAHVGQAREALDRDLTRLAQQRDKLEELKNQL